MEDRGSSIVSQIVSVKRPLCPTQRSRMQTERAREHFKLEEMDWYETCISHD